jgi:hypothetical protein
MGFTSKPGRHWQAPLSVQWPQSAETRSSSLQVRSAPVVQRRAGATETFAKRARGSSGKRGSSGRHGVAYCAYPGA